MKTHSDCPACHGSGTIAHDSASIPEWAALRAMALDDTYTRNLMIGWYAAQAGITLTAAERLWEEVNSQP